MLITKQIKSYMVANHGLAAEATDQDTVALIATKSISGELDQAAFKALSESDSDSRMDKLATKVAEKMGMKTKGHSLDGGKDSSVAMDGRKAYAVAGNAGGTASDSTGNVRVKSVVEQFDGTRSAATYDGSRNDFMKKNFSGTQAHTGEEVGSRYLDIPSKRDLAIAGAWFKHLMTKSMNAMGRPVPAVFRKTELDQQLVEYAVHECEFLGPLGWQEKSNSAQFWFEDERVGDMWIKALLDDSTSGGQEAVPTIFDSAAILTPLLHGELLPLVSVKNISGRRVEGFSVANPTWQWGVNEGTAIAVYDTSNYIAGFDVNVHPATGAMELGRDFQSDSPVAIGQLVVSRYGETLKKELDKMIAIGDGITQPEGIFNAPGVPVFQSANGTAGPPTVGDYESLHFGIPKEFEEEAGGRCTYVSTQTSYKNARGIAVDDANDQRRVFGMKQKTWDLFDYPYKINGSLTNSQVAFVCWNRYRMYRRQGMEVTMESGGKDLQMRHVDLVKVRTRVGGAMDHSMAMAKMLDAKA